jgi:putative endonuclease
MESKREMGILAEDKAINYLAEKGYELLSRNVRYGRAEIDLIVVKANCLVFVEVKFRKNAAFGFPEQMLSPLQEVRIKDAAEAYIIEKKWMGPIRFDVIAILGKEIQHFEDAF